MRALPVTTLACLVVPAACGRGGNAGSARPPGHASLVYYETYDPRSLDPALSTDVPTGEMVALVYDGLTQFDPDGKLLPALADRWTVSRSGSRYVFHLRAGVRFHDGTRVTPAAVRQSVLRVLAPGTPAADTLTVRIIPEPLTRAAEFEAGRLSVMEVPFGETMRWRQQHPDLLLEKPALRVIYVALNNRRGPLQNPKVRQAINYAVNVPEVLATVYGGRGILARGAIPPGLPGNDTTRAGYHYDPVEAKRLLAAAGYGSGIALQLWRNASNVELARVAQAVQAQLEPVGIKIELVERDASSQREAARKGETDMVV